MAVAAEKTLNEVLDAFDFGNPVVGAAANDVLDTVDTPAFLQNVADKGKRIRQRLLTMPHVKEVRGRGMMIGIVLDDAVAAKDVATSCLANGLLVLTAKTLLRLLPPLSLRRSACSSWHG